MTGNWIEQRFIWGGEDNPVHSELSLDAEGRRVLMTVLFGREEDVRRMCEFRGQVWGVADGCCAGISWRVRYGVPACLCSSRVNEKLEIETRSHCY